MVVLTASEFLGDAPHLAWEGDDDAVGVQLVVRFVPIGGEGFQFRAQVLQGLQVVHGGCVCFNHVPKIGQPFFVSKHWDKKKSPRRFGGSSTEKNK